MIKTINPNTQSIIKEYETLSFEQLSGELDQAQIAFLKWKKTSFAERAVLLKNVSDLLNQRSEQYAKTITAEMGKPIQQAKAEVKKCAWVCDFYSENASNFLNDEEVKTQAKKSWITYEPLGVILGIMPWNFPFWQVLRFVAPTLMAGNVVVIKHAPSTLGSAELLQELFIDAGYAEGIYTNAIIETSQVQHVLDHHAVKAVTLTGSEAAGADVASKAAAKIKKSVLELGGSNALIVCQDADLNKALDLAVSGRMQNNGQSCIAVKRLLVHSSIVDSFTKKLIKRYEQLKVGDPELEKTDIGPLARLELAEKLEEQVNDPSNHGAKFEIEFKRKNAFVYPTLITGVKPGMRVFDEELFGPVVTMTVFDEFEEAIELSNSTDFGLGVSVCTLDEKKVLSYLDQFEQGAVFINQMVMSDPRLPFGGVKRSGFGRELGVHGIREFVNTKTVYVAE